MNFSGLFWRELDTSTVEIDNILVRLDNMQSADKRSENRVSTGATLKESALRRHFLIAIGFGSSHGRVQHNAPADYHSITENSPEDMPSRMNRIRVREPVRVETCRITCVCLVPYDGCVRS